MEFIESIDKGGYLEVSLNRPEKRNAFHPQMIAELTQVFSEIKEDSGLSFVLLKGNGKSFCSGADLGWMQSMVNFSLEENKEDSLQLHKMFSSLKKCPLPVVGSVHGYVMGGALGLLACCDIAIAEESTQFCFSEVKLGLAPAVISPFVMAKMNYSSASRFMISGEMFAASEALQSGLVQFSGSPSETEAYLDKLTQLLLSNGAQAMVSTKKLVGQIAGFESDRHVDLTTSLIASLRVGEEAQLRLKEFLKGKSK